jgi:hypothetical protein
MNQKKYIICYGETRRAVHGTTLRRRFSVAMFVPKSGVGFVGSKNIV